MEKRGKEGKRGEKMGKDALNRATLLLRYCSLCSCVSLSIGVISESTLCLKEFTESGDVLLSGDVTFLGGLWRKEKEKEKTMHRGYFDN